MVNVDDVDVIAAAAVVGDGIFALVLYFVVDKIQALLEGHRHKKVEAAFVSPRVGPVQLCYYTLFDVFARLLFVYSR